MSKLFDLANDVVRQAQALGADEVAAAASSTTHTSLIRRDGRVEQTTEATTRGVVVSLLLGNKFSSHSTSDLRPEAISVFLRRAVDATRYLEPDKDRALPDLTLCGRGATAEQLDQLDPRWTDYTPEHRATGAIEVEEALRAVAPDSLISAAVHVGDGRGEVARVMSNGFADAHAEGWFTFGGDMTIADGDRRPEAAAYFGARYHDDLPDPEYVASEVRQRVLDRIGSGPVASGRYTMVLENRAARQILGTLASPLTGGAIHHGRSCLADKLGEKIGSDLLTIRDDPTLGRGLMSRPWDGDGLIAAPRTIIDRGVLQEHYLNVYYGRKLGRPPTTGGRSNWILDPGERGWREAIRDRDQAILVTGFLGGNANSVTGDFSFGVRGTLYEKGEPAQSLSEMNVTGNVLDIFHRLVEVDDTPWKWSSVLSPALIFDDVQFSGT